mmetsp:Transcript_69451/g.104790  ORF Transcript_69451/g.104790 Transcript_69451/m.104790 type:complete len:92 (+) Transcript_69451:458-733(+)
MIRDLSLEVLKRAQLGVWQVLRQLLAHFCGWELEHEQRQCDDRSITATEIVAWPVRATVVPVRTADAQGKLRHAAQRLRLCKKLKSKHQRC